MTTFTKNYSIRRLENFKRGYRGIDSGLKSEEVTLYYSKPVRSVRSGRNQSNFNFWICFILILVFICYFIIKYLNKK